MDELWYPKPEREFIGNKPVSEKQIDYLADPRRGRAGNFSRLRFKIGQTYITTGHDVQILANPGSNTVKVREVETGQVIEHYPIKAIIARKKQVKEEPIMQNAVANAVSVTVAPEQPSSDAVTMTSLELVDFISFGQMKAATRHFATITSWQKYLVS